MMKLTKRELFFYDKVKSILGLELEFTKLDILDTCELYEQRVSKYLPKDRTAAILDLGCGGGDFLYYLHSKGYTNIYGIDVSDESLVIAGKKGLSKYIAKDEIFSFVQNTDKKFDFILMQHVIEHMYTEDACELVENVYKILNKNGKLVLITPNASNPNATFMRYSSITHRILYSDLSMTELLSVAFNKIEVIGINRPCYGVFRTLIYGLILPAYYKLIVLRNRIMFPGVYSKVAEMELLAVGTKT